MALDEKNVYALDSGKNSFPTMTKEQILAAITQAVNKGTIGDIDAGFITKIQELNDQKGISFWLGSAAEFNALTEKRDDILYILTDDTTINDIEYHFTELYKKISGIALGETTVGKAEKANQAGKAGEALQANNLMNFNFVDED